MNKRITLLLFFFPFVIAKAENKVLSLSLREAENYFVEHNLELIAAKYNIDLADAEICQAKLFDNPTISIEQNVYNRLNGRYFDFGKNGETALEIEQPVYLAGQRNKRVRLAKINKKTAIIEFEELLRNLRKELRVSFVELYYSQQVAQIYNSQILSVTEILEIYRNQEKKGNVALIERARIEALLFSLQKEKQEIEQQTVSLQSKMRLLLGIRNEETIDPLFEEAQLRDIDISSVSFSRLESLLEERPDIRGAKNCLKASRADIRLQKSMAFPEVSIKATYDKAGNIFKHYWAVGLNISVPIFNRNQGQIKAAKITAVQNIRKEELLKERAYNQLKESYAHLEKTMNLYRTSHYELLDDFDNIMKGVNENFKKRNISLLEFVDFYESYKETSLQLYQIRKELILAFENINSVVGNEIFSY